MDGIIETDYFSILARIILGSVSSFGEACEKALHEPLDGTMKWLLEEWFSHFENVGDPARRKLMCLALTRLLSTNQTFVLLNLQQLITVWTSVIIELREDEEDAKGDTLVYADPDMRGTPRLVAPEDARTK